LREVFDFAVFFFEVEVEEDFFCALGAGFCVVVFAAAASGAVQPSRKTPKVAAHRIQQLRIATISSPNWTPHRPGG
jgi:hypothetical protein